MSKKYQLKNGLTVILTESHKSPVISVQMWVKNGSADEQKKEEGISHFIEHLVFKGTQLFGVGEIAATIEGSGGELNAYTSFDQTVFYVTISKEFADTGLLAIAEMMGFPKFDPAEIDNEREVVIEEIKRGQDSLSRSASELLFRTNFKHHPYGIPVIGYDSNIRSLKAKKIVEYYQSRYVPRNMFLVVSGNFQTPEMKKKIESLFGKFHDFKVKNVKRKKEPLQGKPRIAILKSKFEQSMAYISWKIPGIRHQDIPALDVLSMILGQGDTSRLVQKLRIEKAIVNSIGASTFTPVDQGLFVISASYNKEKLSEILQSIDNVILEILNDSVKEQEIKRAILNLASEEFYSMETVDGLSRKIGSLEFYFGDIKAQEKYLKAAQALTIQDVYKIAHKYLKPQSLCLNIVTNDEPSEVRKIAQQWLKRHQLQIKTAKKKTQINKKIKHTKFKIAKLNSRPVETEKINLKSGATLLLRKHEDTHLISAKAAYLGGIRSEHQNLDGLTELLSRTWACGTTHRTENQIYQEIESMAAGLSPLSGRNSIGLGLDIMNHFERPGLDLFLDVLTNPIFLDETVQREKLVQLEHIKTRNDNPAQNCIKLFMEKIFQGHPYSRDLMGKVDALKRIHHEELHDYWKENAFARNLTISISGNFDPALWKKEIEKQLGKVQGGTKFKKIFPIENIREDIQAYEETEKEQSHVIFGYRGLKLDDRQKYTLQVIQSILAGQGGRLFLELRDKNSLAYSVSPMKMEGIDTGYFGAYIGCSPDKVTKAISMIQTEFKRLINERVGEVELNRAKKYIIGRHDIDLQKTSAVAAAILYSDIYDIDFNEPFLSSEYYMAVTAKDVQELSEKIFSQKTVTSVVGPNNPF